MNKTKFAFTLIELLVVIAIIGILSGLIVVSMSGVTQKANISKAQVFSNSLKNNLMLDLVAEWKLDEITGTSPYYVLDSWSKGVSGLLKDGTTSVCSFSGTLACPQLQTNCIYDKCLSFDGSNDYVQIASLPYKSIHGPSSIELWFNSSATTGHIFSDHCIELGLYLSGGNVYGRAYNTIDGGHISLNEWHHIALTHSHPNGTTGTQITFYVDGNKKTPQTLTITTQNGYYDNPFYLGTDLCNAGTFFTGMIDNARYYNDAISSSAIKENYYLGLNQLLAKKMITKGDYNQRIAKIAKSLPNLDN